MSETTYPTLFKIAMDYLPIQASSVPSERVFSSSAETDTKKRNRINHVLMESLQMLKFALKKERFNFMHGWVTPEDLMSEVEFEGTNLLSLLLGENDTEGAMDNIMRHVNQDSR
jgi:hypothetical protein